MSKQLTLSATLAVFCMSVFALSTSFAGLGEADQRAPAGHAANAAEAPAAG